MVNSENVISLMTDTSVYVLEQHSGHTVSLAWHQQGQTHPGIRPPPLLIITVNSFLSHSNPEFPQMLHNSPLG